MSLNPKQVKLLLNFFQSHPIYVFWAEQTLIWPLKIRAENLTTADQSTCFQTVRKCQKVVAAHAYDGTKLSCRTLAIPSTTLCPTRRRHQITADSGRYFLPAGRTAESNGTQALSFLLSTRASYDIVSHKSIRQRRAPLIGSCHWS
jgi:hypothetical protein